MEPEVPKARAIDSPRRAGRIWDQPLYFPSFNPSHGPLQFAARFRPQLQASELRSKRPPGFYCTAAAASVLGNVNCVSLQRGAVCLESVIN